VTSQHSNPHERPRLSVVVPIRNEGRHIGTLLAQLLDQSLPADHYEVIVADGRSEDDSRTVVLSLAERHPQLRLVDNPGIRSSAGRNAGATVARGDYLLFVDGHCSIPSRTLLADVLLAFEGGALAISRPQPLIPGAPSALARAIVHTRRSVFGHVPGSQIFDERERMVDPTSAGCGYTVELFEQLGGFDEAFDAAEDVEFNLRVRRQGVSALHSSAFAVEYFARDRWSRLFRQMLRYGIGRGRLLRKWPRETSWAAAAPACLIAAFAVLAFSSLFLPLVHAWLLGALALATTVLLVVALTVATKSGPVMGLLSAPTLIVILIASGTGFLMGLLRKPSAPLRVQASEELTRSREDTESRADPDGDRPCTTIPDEGADSSRRGV
jgi:succinoglycan biosynthesis protein ExoA